MAGKPNSTEPIQQLLIEFEKLRVDFEKLRTDFERLKVWLLGSAFAFTITFVTLLFRAEIL